MYHNPKNISHTQIKISYVNVFFTNQDERVHINMLDQSQTDWAKEQGLSYMRTVVLLILCQVLYPIPIYLFLLSMLP